VHCLLHLTVCKGHVFFIGQILAKPGPSGENQSQDSLQGEYNYNL
jgi:hypothetical protein